MPPINIAPILDPPISKRPCLKRLAWVLMLVIFSACTQLRPAPGPQETEAQPSDAPPLQTVLVEEKPPADDQTLQAYSAFLKSAIARSRGDYAAATDYLKEALAGDPESGHLNYLLALTEKELRHPQKALPYAHKARELEPDRLEYSMLLGEIYTLLEDLPAAAEQFEYALRLDPSNQRLRQTLATLAIRSRQYDKALEHLDLLLAENPGLVAAAYYRGRVFMEMERFEDAEAAFLETLQLNRNFEPALFDLGTLYQITGRNVQAITTYEQLLAIFPENNSARERLVNLYLELGLEAKAQQQVEQIRSQSEPGEPERHSLGIIYLRQGRLDEAIDELKAVLDAWPEDDRTLYYLGLAYAEKNDPDGALSYLVQIGPQSQHFVNARLNMAYILDRDQRHQEAAATLREAIRNRPGETEFYTMLSLVLENAGDMVQAIEAVHQGLQKDPEKVELIYRLGVLLDKQGQRDECLQQMRRIIELDPGHADALNYIGYSYAEQGIRLDEALELIEKALESNPDSGYIIDSLGWVYFQKGLYDHAVHYLSRAVELEPKDPTIHEHLGDAFFQLQDYEQALEIYLRALHLGPADEQGLKQKISATETLLKNGQ